MVHVRINLVSLIKEFDDPLHVFFIIYIVKVKSKSDQPLQHIGHKFLINLTITLILSTLLNLFLKIPTSEEEAEEATNWRNDWKIDRTSPN